MQFLYYLYYNVSRDITRKKTTVWGGRTSDVSPYLPIFVYYLPSFPMVYKLLRNYCIYNSFGYDMTKCTALHIFDPRDYICMKFYR